MAHQFMVTTNWPVAEIAEAETLLDAQIKAFAFVQAARQGVLAHCFANDRAPPLRPAPATFEFWEAELVNVQEALIRLQGALPSSLQRAIAVGMNARDVCAQIMAEQSGFGVKIIDRDAHPAVLPDGAAIVPINETEPLSPLRALLAAAELYRLKFVEAQASGAVFGFGWSSRLAEINIHCHDLRRWAEAMEGPSDD